MKPFPKQAFEGLLTSAGVLEVPGLVPVLPKVGSNTGSLGRRPRIPPQRPSAPSPGRSAQQRPILTVEDMTWADGARNRPKKGWSKKGGLVEPSIARLDSMEISKYWATT